MDSQTKQLLTRTEEAHWGGHSHGNSRNKDVIWLQERATVIRPALVFILQSTKFSQ